MGGYLPASMDAMADQTGPLSLGPDYKALQDFSQRKQVCSLDSHKLLFTGVGWLPFLFHFSLPIACITSSRLC